MRSALILGIVGSFASVGFAQEPLDAALCESYQGTTPAARARQLTAPIRRELREQGIGPGERIRIAACVVRAVEDLRAPVVEACLAAGGLSGEQVAGWSQAFARAVAVCFAADGRFGDVPPVQGVEEPEPEE